MSEGSKKKSVKILDENENKSKKTKKSPNPCNDSRFSLGRNGAKCESTRSTTSQTPSKQKHAFQVHLKKESDEFQNDTVEYILEQPVRVSVRMEYLMQTTKVRLNDKDFMDNLYSKLEREEVKSHNKATLLRQKVERERVKGLVVSGEMEAPPDMQYLHEHPILRVNTLLKQLENHDQEMLLLPKTASEITPVEPYEFNGDEYFKHLHQKGVYYIPSEELRDHEEKLSGKIARAKLRLMEKRRKHIEDTKMMKILNGDVSKPGEPPYEELKQDKSTKELIEKLRQQSELQADRFRRHRVKLERREKERKARSAEKQEKRDWVFLEEREKERRYYREKYQNNMNKKKLGHLQPRELYTFEKSDRIPVLPYDNVFRVPPTPPELKESKSFKNLRKAFNVEGSHNLYRFRSHENPLIAHYIDKIKPTKRLMKNGQELSDLFIREQLEANDFMIKLNRLSYENQRH